MEDRVLMGSRTARVLSLGSGGLRVTGFTIGAPPGLRLVHELAGNPHYRLPEFTELGSPAVLWLSGCWVPLGSSPDLSVSWSLSLSQYLISLDLTLSPVSPSLFGLKKNRTKEERRTGKKKKEIRKGRSRGVRELRRVGSDT
jgi:hypothetical protein